MLMDLVHTKNQRPKTRHSHLQIIQTMNTSSDSLSISLNESSFDSRRSSPIKEQTDAIRRVNRFLARMDIKSVPSIEEGEIRSSVPNGRFQSRMNGGLSPPTSPSCGIERACYGNTSARSKTPESCLGCTGTIRSEPPVIDSSFMVCTGASINVPPPPSPLTIAPPKQRKKYMIEGIHGPVLTEKKLTNDCNRGRRKGNRFKRFVEARQTERAKKFDTSLDFIHLREVRKEAVVIRERTGSNDSPTSIMEDISVIIEKRSDATSAFSFTILETNNSNLKSSMQQTPHKQKKNLTWWDEDANAHKPFLLKTDETLHGEDDETVNTEDTSVLLFESSGCQANNLKDLYADCRDRFKCALNDIKEEATKIGKGVTEENLASFSENINDDRKECSLLTKRILNVLTSCTMITPPVCVFEANASDDSMTL